MVQKDEDQPRGLAQGIGSIIAVVRCVFQKDIYSVLAESLALQVGCEPL